MKKSIYTLAAALCALGLCTLGLSACATIDEERFAGLPCADLKELIASENLIALAEYGPGRVGGGSPADFFEQSRVDRDSRLSENIFDTDEDTQYGAELRAAFRNNCK